MSNDKLNLIGLQLQLWLDPLTLGHPGLPLACTSDLFLGPGGPHCYALTLSLSVRKTGFFLELEYECLSSEGLIVHEIQSNYQAPMSNS